MGLSPAQIVKRLEGITATDVSAIVGVSPYRSRIQVWQEKRGQAPPWVNTERSKWGELLEPVVRKDYGERHGMRIEVPGTLVHPDRAWMMATPDGIAYRIGSPDPERGLEIKCHTWRVQHLYGAPGSDEIPLWELCQVAWNLGVTGLVRWDLVAFIDGQPTDYTIDRDEELLAGLVEQCERFLVDNVQGGAVPDPDGTEAFDDYLKARWASNPGAALEASQEDLIRIEGARAIREQIASCKTELGLVVQELKLRIADAEGMAWTNAKGKPEKLTWKRSKPTRRIAHEIMARDMRDDARLTLSAAAETVDRAMLCLATAGHTPIGSNTRAAIDAAEIRTLVEQLSQALRRISDRTDDKYATTTPGNRPFCWPRSWGTNTDEEQK